MPSRNRRRVRNFTIALLLLGCAVWIVPSYFSAERYRRRLQAGLEQSLHRPVKFGALSFHVLPRPGFSIENAEVGEDPDFGYEPLARVDQIDCDLRWHSLWRSRMDFAHLRLDRPNFNIVLNSRGEWNVERLLLQSGVTVPAGAGGMRKPSVATEQLDLEVNDARINLQVGLNKKPFALTNVKASLRVNPAQRRIEFKLVASPVRSDLTIPTPGPVEASGVWTPGNDLRGPLDVRLRTQGALLYDWVPVVTGANPQVYGVLDVDVHLTGSLPDLAVEGETRLTEVHRWREPPPADPMPWTFRYRARLERRPERVQVESLDASFAHSHLHLTGSVEKLSADPQLDLVVSLKRSRLEDWLAVVHRVWPHASSWNLRGSLDATLAVRGSWKQRRYGGYVGVQEVSLETPSRSFPVSDIAVRINERGAILSPLQITLAPRVTLSALGTIGRTDRGPQYEVQFAAKAVPLHDAILFGRGLGIGGLQGIDATGAATAVIRLVGSAWPPARPVLTARAQLRAGRLLVPGLTEPLNIPRANLQITGDQITAAPVLAVLGTSVFTARLFHHGGRNNPWQFDLRANSLELEQGALWFDALGHRPPLPLLARLPGLASFAARRHAASQILESLNAEGTFATPALSYRGVLLKDFQGTFAVAGPAIRMTSAKFNADGGHGEATGAVDFTTSPPGLSAKISLAGVSVQVLTARLPGPLGELRGSLSGSGSFQTRGLAREELAENLAGQMALRVKDISFGDFDPVGALAQQAFGGKLEAAQDQVAAIPVMLNVGIRDRRFLLKTTPLELSGALLEASGTYLAPAGPLDINVHADFRRLRRRWLQPESDPHAPSDVTDLRLSGPLDHLTVAPEANVASGKGNRGDTGVK